MGKGGRILLKCAVVAVFATAAIIALSEVSPIYDFAEPKPFSGPDIFDPYASFDPSVGWKRANFHTHTRVEGIFNECPEWPDRVYADYMGFGYDIVAFSNHNLLTPHPTDTLLYVPVYEHGYNLFKFHKLVFNPQRMILHDIMVPFLASQRQFELDYLGRNADFTVLNHPDRTCCTTRSMMRSLSGYRLVEADCGADSTCILWDEALSAGHYSFGVADDDCHDSRDEGYIAVRCSWWNTPSASYEDVRRSLNSGCGYFMRIPPFYGDWDAKYAFNASLPKVEDIGLHGTDTLSLTLSRPAAAIRVWGQNHTVLDSVLNSASLRYVFKPQDSYARVSAEFGNGVIIFSNPFARYDKTEAETPFVESPHPVNLPLTVLFNLAVLAVTAALLLCCFRIVAHKKRKA